MGVAGPYSDIPRPFPLFGDARIGERNPRTWSMLNMLIEGENCKDFDDL
jgi:hypothetical protein